MDGASVRLPRSLMPNETSLFDRISSLFRRKSSLFDSVGNSVKEANHYRWLKRPIRGDTPQI
jgi:hypothetical protein